MSTFMHVIPEELQDQPASQVTAEGSLREHSRSAVGTWDLESFAEEQIRGLVRQLFLAGSKPSRQVVFAAVNGETDIAALCRQAAEALSEESYGTTCLLEAHFPTPRGNSTSTEIFNADHQPVRLIRDCAVRVSNKLWYAPADVFLGERNGGISPKWLRPRLAEFRLEFDHLLIQAPAATATNQAALLARLCDGLVLVLEANSTRRAAAQMAKERLIAAHVRLLGTVLTERTFPIPRAIYERI